MYTMKITDTIRPIMEIVVNVMIDAWKCLSSTKCFDNKPELANNTVVRRASKTGK
jgi:hypothetical protein